MKLVFSPLALEQWNEWKRTNPQVAKRIKKLLEDICTHPFTGIGKPEPLKFDLAGKWSRRINSEHRIVYKVSNGMIEVDVLSMKYHYPKQ
jgi:toxin YoeB